MKWYIRVLSSLPPTLQSDVDEVVVGMYKRLSVLLIHDCSTNQKTITVVFKIPSKKPDCR